MPVPPPNATYTLWRPVNAPDPFYTDAPCHVVPALSLLGRQLSTNSANSASFPSYTHWMDVPFEQDIQTGWHYNTANGLLNWTLAGDKVRIEYGAFSEDYTVSWMEYRWTAGVGGDPFQRVYLMRMSRDPIV